MIVRDILQGIYDALGFCNPQEVVYDRIQRAMTLLQNQTNWNPLIGYMDICTQDCVVTIPDEVDVVLAANVGGRPSEFRNKWFEFHLNGPGSECCNESCYLSWDDLGTYGTYRDPLGECKLAAFSDDPRDGQGALSLKIYGYNQKGNWISTDWGNGGLEDGFPLPIFTSYATGSKAPDLIYRIQRVLKPVTKGNVKIVAYDGQTQAGVQIGWMKPWETQGEYRRIKISGGGSEVLRTGPNSCSTTWVRMRIRKKQYKIRSDDDVIFLHSEQALYMAAQALKKYEANLLDDGDKYMARAVQFLQDREKILQGPNNSKIQISMPALKGNARSNLI